MPAVFNACSESSPCTEVQLCCGFLIFGEAHRSACGVGRHEAEAVVGCSSQPAQISFHFKLSVCDVTYVCVEQCKSSFSARQF